MVSLARPELTLFYSDRDLSMSTSAEDKRPRLLGRIASLLWVMVIAVVVGFFYFASSLWVTFLLAAFLPYASTPWLPDWKHSCPGQLRPAWCSLSACCLSVL